jgi:fructokinase
MGGVIVVAGESLIDRVAEAGGSVRATPGGGPFNVARTLARLGAPVAFAGRLSTDAHGVLLRSALRDDGVDLSLVTATGAPTLLADAALDEHGVARYRFTPDRSAAAGFAPGDVADALPATTTALVVGSLGLVLEPMATTIEALVAAVGDAVLVVLDPNVRPIAIVDEAGYRARLARVLRRVDIVKASTDDLAWLEPDRQPIDAAARLLRDGPALVLVTDGPRPVRIVTNDGVGEVAVPAAVVVDTVGAGDAFGAGFLAAWTRAGRGRPDLADRAAVEAATRFAVEVAARTVARPGADPPTLAELVAGRERGTGGW